MHLNAESLPSVSVEIFGQTKRPSRWAELNKVLDVGTDHGCQPQAAHMAWQLARVCVYATVVVAGFFEVSSEKRTIAIACAVTQKEFELHYCSSYS